MPTQKAQESARLGGYDALVVPDADRDQVVALEVALGLTPPRNFEAGTAAHVELLLMDDDRSYLDQMSRLKRAIDQIASQLDDFLDAGNTPFRDLVTQFFQNPPISSEAHGTPDMVLIRSRQERIENDLRQLMHRCFDRLMVLFGHYVELQANDKYVINANIKVPLLDLHKWFHEWDKYAVMGEVRFHEELVAYIKTNVVEDIGQIPNPQDDEETPESQLEAQILAQFNFFESADAQQNVETLRSSLQKALIAFFEDTGQDFESVFNTLEESFRTGESQVTWLSAVSGLEIYLMRRLWAVVGHIESTQSTAKFTAPFDTLIPRVAFLEERGCFIAEWDWKDHIRLAILDYGFPRGNYRATFSALDIAPDDWAEWESTHAAHLVPMSSPHILPVVRGIGATIAAVGAFLINTDTRDPKAEQPAARRVAKVWTRVTATLGDFWGDDTTGGLPMGNIQNDDPDLGAIQIDVTGREDSQ